MINYKSIYSIALLIIFPFILIYLLILSIKNRDYNFIENRLGSITKLKNKNSICIHCASLGEVNGAKELIKEIIKKNNVLISTNTYSGKIRANKLFPKLDVVYFPLDYKFMVSNWLKSLKIKSMIIYETEIWPNFYRVCGYKNIKICIVNARLQKNLHKKKFIKKIYEEALDNCDFIMCKSDYEKEKYLKLEIEDKKIFSLGNLKYSFTTNMKKEHEINSEAARYDASKDYFLMASTHDPDEKNFIKAIKELLNNEISVVIAPRHIKRSKKIAKFFKDNGVDTYFLSQMRDHCLGNWGANAVLIIDTFGDLVKFYHNARYVYVGGGFSKRGVQNIIEPTIYGKPILVGPNIDNFYEEIMSLKGKEAITIIDDNKNFSIQENIARYIREYHNLSDEVLIKKGAISKTHSLKFKNIVKKYVEFLERAKIIN